MEQGGSDHRPCRKTYTNRAKLDILESVGRRLQDGEQLKPICRELGIQASQFRRWKLATDRLQKCNPNARSVCKGRRSCLFDIDDTLLQWIFELRQQGMAVSYRMLELKACELLPAFCHKTATSKRFAVYRFGHAHRFVIRLKTHESQRPPAEMIAEAKDFVKCV